MLATPPVRSTAARFPRGRWLPLAFALTLVAIGCRSLSPARDDRVAAEVLAELKAFEAAEVTLDPDVLLSFLAPDFTMLQDGVRVDRAGTETQMRSGLPSLRSLESRFEDVEVIVLGPDAALTSMTFRDVITDGEGRVTRSRGPSTLLWRKRADGWKIVFADSDHYPAD